MNDYISKRKYNLGFTSLDKETVKDNLSVQGSIPSWLSGTLVRNGPAKLEVGDKKMRYWFDGFAMLHAFSFQEGKASYANKFLESRGYKYAKEKGEMGYLEFATDPCRSIFKRFTQIFSQPISHNANVNISKIANEFVALTETPLPIEFDLKTLKTLGVFKYTDNIKGQLTTAHPHYDFDRNEGINYLTHFSAKSSYNVYRLPNGLKTRELIGTVPVKEPSYMHSFGLTKNYIILAEYPLIVNPLALVFGKTFVESLEWKPEKGTNFLLLNRKTGQFQRYTTEGFFAFHHVNAFENNDKVIIDVVTYHNADIIQSFYLDVLRGETGKDIFGGILKRYEISFSNSSVKHETISEDPIELPRINYQLSNTKNYRFVYAVGYNKNNQNNFLDRLVKIDIQNRNSKIWREDECYPGEPVFVPSLNAIKEDEGVVVSVVLNAKKGNSFLLILDAGSFTEIARAEVPHHIPFGFHGQFYSEQEL